MRTDFVTPQGLIPALVALMACTHTIPPTLDEKAAQEAAVDHALLIWSTQ